MLRMSLCLLAAVTVGLVSAGCVQTSADLTPAPPRRADTMAETAPAGWQPPANPQPQEQPVADTGPVNPVVIIETSKGTIAAELWPDKSPETVENFLAYVDDGFFDGTIFHRVIPGFMIQGGGFTPDMRQKAGKSPVVNEARADVGNDRGTLAMARTGDPHSATAQFFINHVDNAGLDHTAKTPQGYGYCVFGKVTDGLDVVDAIATVRTATVGPFENVPTDAVEIVSIRRQ